MVSESVGDHRAGHTAPQPRLSITSVYGLAMIFVEVSMQTTAFAVRHFNITKQYPFHTGTMVFCIELAKFVICYLLFCVQHKRLRFMPSPVFVFPAFFLVAANGAFLHCGYYIAPPTWNVFHQSRAVFTAFGCYVIFGRQIERRTWAAVGLLMVTTVVAVVYCPGVVKSKFYPYEADEMTWLCAAFTGVACSAFLHDSFEYISQLGKRPLAEKHMQLYFFSTVLSFTLAELTSNGNLFELDIRMFFPLDFYICILVLVVWGLGGPALFIALKKLSTPADEAILVLSWTPTVLFVASTVVSSVVFPTQPGYSYGATAVICLLMAIVSGLYSSSGSPARPPAEPCRVTIIDA